MNSQKRMSRIKKGSKVIPTLTTEQQLALSKATFYPTKTIPMNEVQAQLTVEEFEIFTNIDGVIEKNFHCNDCNKTHPFTRDYVASNNQRQLKCPNTGLKKSYKYWGPSIRSFIKTNNVTLSNSYNDKQETSTLSSFVTSPSITNENREISDVDMELDSRAETSKRNNIISSSDEDNDILIKETQLSPVRITTSSKRTILEHLSPPPFSKRKNLKMIDDSSSDVEDHTNCGQIFESIEYQNTVAISNNQIYEALMVGMKKNESLINLMTTMNEKIDNDKKELLEENLKLKNTIDQLAERIEKIESTQNETSKVQRNIKSSYASVASNDNANRIIENIENIGEISDNDSEVSTNTIKEIKKIPSKFAQRQKFEMIKKAKRMVRIKRNNETTNTDLQRNFELEHVYVNGLYRLPIREIRQMLKACDVQISKIKDLSWCTANTLEFLVYEDFVDELRTILKGFGWNIVDNFDLSKPPSENAPEAIKERALTQSARHYAKLLYRRKHIAMDGIIVNYYNSFIEKQSERFKSKFDHWIKAIELNPSTFFPELRKMNETTTIKEFETTVPAEVEAEDQMKL